MESSVSISQAAAGFFYDLKVGASKLLTSNHEIIIKYVYKINFYVWDN